jgi:predicted GH43/DUF377 family glycosyl hydrolase
MKLGKMRSSPKTMGIFSVALAACICMVLFNNFSASSSPSGPNYSKLGPGCFRAGSANAVLTKGSLIPGADWNDPSVIKIGSSYVMYASSDQNFDGNIKIYRMISTDGIRWALSPAKPVFQANPDVKSWDHRAVETPSVIYFGGKYHLFYTGYPSNLNDSSSYKIGHAVSTNGISWTRDPNFILAPTNPAGAPNLDFNQYVVGEPGAVVFQNKIYLYFTALGANTSVGTTLQTIGLTTSSDGVHWSKAQNSLSPDQSLYPRSSWLGYSAPQPVVLNGQVHLFFDVVQATPWKQLKLHHAKSSNGVTGWIQDTNPIYSDKDFNWASNEIRSPSALLDGNNLLLWFAGDNGSSLGIGLAECPL